MKLKKVTQPKPAKSKWYDDACGTALALELVGERWSLLIVRELMFGGRRFGELKANLPGISANILTQRLEGMEASHILTRRKLPPPASVQIYELTPWGYQSERAIQELGRWATRSPEHDTSLPLSAASMMLSFRTMISAERAARTTATVGFRFGPESFVGTIADGDIAIRRGEPEGANLVISSDPVSLASVIYGGRPLEDAESAGSLTLSGDRALFARFATFFPLPPKGF